MLEDAIRVIQSVEEGVIVPRTFQNVLSGYSGNKIIALLQSLTGLLTTQADCYLEIGVFQGLTLLSNAAANPSVLCFGIDNFSQFDAADNNLSLVLERRRQLNAENAELIVADFERALARAAQEKLAGRRVGMYFVDGPHDYRSQILCLLLARPILAANCVIVIDDCNYPHVRQASADFLTIEPTFKLLFEAYTRSHPENMDAPHAAQARSGWWNGVNVLVRDPEDRLPRVLPTLRPSRELFYQDHLVHAQRGAEIALEALRFAESILQPRQIPRAGMRLVRAVRGASKMMRARFSGLNTYSSELPAAHLIRPL